MENTNPSVNKETTAAKKGDEGSSSSKTPQNENPVEEMLNLNIASEDASILFTDLPDYIWKLITDKFLDSESLRKLTLASSVFRNLLLLRRVEFLFPRVWKVLGVKFEKQEDDVYSYDIDKMYPDRDLSRFRDGKTPWCSRILTLRLVCKSWCEGVDKFYEDLTRNEKYQMWDDIYEHHYTGQAMANWTHTARNCDTNPSWEGFINHFGPTLFDTDKKRNPIFGRFISIGVLDARDFGILDLLSKYGHHFWFCHLEFISDLEPRNVIVTRYTLLTKILKLLPNLKTLRVQYQGKAENDDLAQLITLHPLPKLYRLEFMSSNEVPTCIFNALVSANSHISMLEVTTGGEDGGYDIYSFPMPNLKQLSIEYHTQANFYNLINHKVNWALEKIYVRFNCNLPLSRLQLFSLLENKWTTTLTNVAVTLPPNNNQNCLNDADAMHDDLILRLNLPKVQRLRVESPHIFSLDFILPMQSLELLEVILTKIEPGETLEKRLRLLERNQVVQFVGYFGRFHESNIWKLFPNLKSIQIFETDRRFCRTFLEVCTRENFERKEEAGADNGSAARNGKDSLWIYRSTHKFRHEFLQNRYGKQTDGKFPE